MTGGGDENPAEDQGLENPGSDEVDVGRDGDDGEDEDDDVPVGTDVRLNENDPDPTAGASDVGGLAGGLDDA
jgi:hypothetical protein